jgi:hypothetical protein
LTNNICYSVSRAPTLPSNLSINTEEGGERQGGKKKKGKEKEFTNVSGIVEKKEAQKKRKGNNTYIFVIKMF